MIDIIRTYEGYSRPEGKVKQTFTYMYRCSKCENIKGKLLELRKDGCTHEFKATPTTKSQNKI